MTTTLPLLAYKPKSQNQRVAGFEVANDDRPTVYTTAGLLDITEMGELINAAYRQVFHEQQMLKFNRQLLLESQLRSGQITVKEFIRGLATSDSFRRLVFDTNNNYRFVELCVQRLLGRNVYDEREKIARSIVLATKGLPALIDDLLNSDEYLERFGDDTVPHQIRRVLPNRSKGELPFERMARYDAYYLAGLPQSSYSGNGAARLDYVRWAWQKNPPQVLGLLGKGVILLGAGTIVLGCLAVLLGL